MRKRNRNKSRYFLCWMTVCIISSLCTFKNIFKHFPALTFMIFFLFSWCHQSFCSPHIICYPRFLYAQSILGWNIYTGDNINLGSIIYAMHADININLGSNIYVMYAGVNINFGSNILCDECWSYH